MAHWHHGPRTSDNVSRLEVLTYDGARFWTGPTDDEATGRIQEAGGRRAEIYRGLRELRERPRRGDPRALSRTSRGG